MREGAYLTAGSARDTEALLRELDVQGVIVRGGTDVYVRAYARFGIEEARELRSRAQARAFGARRAFILAMPSMTADAQNALLKTIEEPPAGALFFFIVPAPELLLPTFRSRAQRFPLPRAKGGDAAPLVEPKRFLVATPEKRIDMLKTYFSKEKGEDSTRDVEGMTELLIGLEQELAGGPAEHREALRAIYRARKYLNDKGALLKPLMEQVALLV
ncbi:hypothetical protein COU20_00220 [Candidatus Kaiserbacteria bacterium CG10_big_fil_rev_8_21_14_0_10_59_10]|uniref:DNA polymerase III subunit delta n=1 Tax=Candidatus Kaiserbacteria bacterium CG10_big_fil_rev_8_21_14_0_10_59_10 TaxID=1974612 RepID=A0A2H0UAN3_9BACT|nr:MAG: hypothetical protein COU20_00220 [Candidatus Kaiserbacteria bacterium CG10_big_fil_rev_8_21_14_0_10_59_10]